MSKISLISISLVLVSFPVMVLGQEVELPDPGLTPDSPFYFLEIISEEIGNFFTFGDLRKAERYANLASERVAEAQAMAERGRPDLVARTLERYRAQLNRSLERAERARVRGERVARVSEIVAEATSKHLAVLEEVLERVPKEAKEAINRALERSKTGHITSLKALAGENPDKAVEIGTNTTKGRLEKAKEKAVEKDSAGVERILRDYEDFQAALEEVRGKGKTLGVLVSENRVEEIEDLDEIEESAEEISDEMEKKVKETKTRLLEKLRASLRDVADEDPEKATEINLRAAEARLRRAEAEAEEEPEEVEEILNEFGVQYKFGEEISEIAKGLGKDTTTVEQLVGRATAIHLEILAMVYEKVPDEAKPAVEKAMEVSVKGHEKAVEVLMEKEAINEVPEETPMPETISEEVKGRIKEKVERELEEEREMKLEIPVLPGELPGI